MGAWSYLGYLVGLCSTPLLLNHQITVCMKTHEDVEKICETTGNKELAQEILSEMFAQGILTENEDEIIEIQFKQETLVCKAKDSIDENEV